MIAAVCSFECKGFLPARTYFLKMLGCPLYSGELKTQAPKPKAADQVPNTKP